MELSVTSAPNLGREEVGGVCKLQTGGLGYQLIIIFVGGVISMPAGRFEFNKFSQQKSRPQNESGSGGTRPQYNYNRILMSQ